MTTFTITTTANLAELEETSPQAVLILTAAWLLRLLASFCCGGKGLLLHVPALASPAPTVTQQANLYIKLFGVSRGAAFRKWVVILYIFFYCGKM